MLVEIMAQCIPADQPAPAEPPQTLAQYIAAWQGFDWHTANCAHFAAGWAAPHALAGVVMPSDPREVRATLRAMGVASLRDAVQARLGEPIHPWLARPGDVVLSHRTLGLCVGRQWAAPLPERGVGFFPVLGGGRYGAQWAWRARR
jgi:hypothetical protein